MKKALVLAGGIAQVALIEELKRRGYRTLLADMNPACVAAGVCDEFCPVSAMDVEGIKQLARERDIDMVLTACADQILVAEVEVCQALGLRTYLDLDTTRKVSDKHYMKDVFLRNGIPTSRYAVLDRFEDEKLTGLSYPLVVKPVDAYSARGVRKCRNREEVQKFLAEAIQISRSKTAVVEEFVDGRELTVEAFVCRGKATVLCIGSKQKLKDGGFVLSGSLYPADLSPELREEIGQTTQKIADAFHLKDSPININMITDGNHAYVLHEGILPEIGELKAENRYLMTCYLYCSDGVLDRYAGFEEMHEQGIISRYYLVRKPGHRFKSIDSNGDRAAGFFVQDDDYDRLLQKYDTALKNLKVLDKDGRNLVRMDLI